MATTAYVIYSRDCGVYLGQSFRNYVWSVLDRTGRNVAHAFPSEEEAEDLIQEAWGEWGGDTEDMTVHPVSVSDPEWATEAECLAAGLPAWGSRVESEAEAMSNGPRPPLCGATHLGDCVADLAVYHEVRRIPRPNGEDFSWFWTWRLGPMDGKVYARREDAIAAVREYIAMMTEIGEKA